jgi:hypothetical protein
MVNTRLPQRRSAHTRALGLPISRANTGDSSVNQFLSKPFEFSENSRRILFEYAQKREQPLQACLLAYGQAAKKTPAAKKFAIRDRAMFFILRVAFWMTIVLALLPTGSSRTATSAQVDTSDAVAAAGATVSDVSSFCDRQPDACEVGAQAAVAIGQRAQAGAKMVYEFLHDQMARSETGSLPETKAIKVRAVPTHPGSQTTLRPADLEPAWRGRAETVPMPRPRPDGKRRA